MVRNWRLTASRRDGLLSAGGRASVARGVVLHLRVVLLVTSRGKRAASSVDRCGSSSPGPLADDCRHGAGCNRLPALARPGLVVPARRLLAGVDQGRIAAQLAAPFRSLQPVALTAWLTLLWPIVAVPSVDRFSLAACRRDRDRGVLGD